MKNKDQRSPGEKIYSLLIMVIIIGVAIGGYIGFTNWVRATY